MVHERITGRNDGAVYAKVVLLVLVCGCALFAQDAGRKDANVTRATLENGMRVVIIRDALAPVVTVMQNYLVGGDETPAGFPGMAHAQEHMAFRGCRELSADQIAAIYAQLGGLSNADTQQNITQYFTTIPAADVELALRMDAACMQDVDDAQAEWDKEKGAIEQEVARDLSNPTYKFLTRLNEDMFSGTVYSHDALGTKPSFDATTGEMLKKFYKDWYAPNNAILVISGDVDPAAVLAKVKELYGKIERRSLPMRPEVKLQPVKSESFTLDSNLPYALSFIAYRMPGTKSPDYAAVRILSDVLASQRGNLYALVPQGKALAAEFGIGETFPEASVAFGVLALPAEADAASVTEEMRKILDEYAAKGVPAELVDAAKRGEVAGAEFARNSIPGLAESWSQALAAEGRNSPDEIVEALKRVTLADVNRVAKQYLVEQSAITAQLKPVPSGEAVSDKGFGGSEQLTSAPTKPVALPEWAAIALARGEEFLHSGVVDRHHTAKRAAGDRQDRQDESDGYGAGERIAQRRSGSPAGKDGVGDVLDELFTYGTTTLDRLAFQKALDDIAASETPGLNFSLRVLKQDFSRGVQLLADNELNPALPGDALETIKPQIAQFAAGNLKSPGHRTDRAVLAGLLPAKDPVAARSHAADDFGAHSGRRQKILCKGGAARPDDHRGDRGCYLRGSQWRDCEMVRRVEEFRREAGGDFAGGAFELGFRGDRAGPRQLQDSVHLAEMMGITRFDADYYALQMGNHVLGGGFYATRLYHDLRQVNGYVYNVDVKLDARKTRADYTVTYGCDPVNVSKARQLVQRDLVAMQKEDVSPAELQQAKALLLRQLSLRAASEDDLAGSLLGFAEMNLPLDELNGAASRYASLAAAEVRAAFAKWIRPEMFVQVVRGPAPQ